MSVMPTDPRSDLLAPAAPLSETERSAAADIARRLRVELREVVRLLPERQRGASAMARTLKIDRNICQRVVASIAGDDPDEGVLVRLPGIQGLRQFIAAVGRIAQGEAREQLAAATAAIDAFEHLIERLAGSQRRLRQRLEADLASDHGLLRGPSDDPGSRRALFRSAAEVVGRWSEAVLNIAIIRPTPGDPMLTEGARVKGLIGHVWRPSAVSLELGESAPDRLALGPRAGDGPGAHRTLTARPASGATPDSLLAEFCTSPLPRVTSRTLDNRTTHVIDAAEPVGDTPSDIVIGHRRSTPDKHPASQDPPIGEVSSLITFPARRLVSDVYLHRDIARRCIPSLELHLWSPAAGQGGMARWSTRFPGGPRLELLGGGLRHTASDAWSRHAELVAHAFARLGWDPEEFVGYRCDVSYPLWRTAYVMLFDFAGLMPGDAPAK